MPERQRGRNPGRRPEKEYVEVGLPEYYRASRYAGDYTSRVAYEEVRQAIYDNECALSTYRTILLPDETWHLLVLGDTPQEHVKSLIEQSLSRGVAVELPEEVWRTFNTRRLDQMREGKPFVEKRLGRRRL